MTATPAPDRGLVLVVDDDAALREACADALSEAGFGVETAADGRQAMNLLWRTGFDVVLSDVVMPDMNGLAFLRAVRERDLDVPVLLMTGSPNLDHTMQAIEYGALRYLVKPVREDDLTAAVEAAVRMHRLAKVKREALAHLGLQDKLVGDRAGLEASFTRALESLWVAYQPIVSAADHASFGHEALARSREQALPDPAALFSAAERLGRVHELGRTIRGRVAAASHGVGDAVFVNLHPHDLLDEALFASRAGLSGIARTVVLEITERAPLDGIPDLRSRIAALRKLGYRIAIDDLGAGYAGLTTFAALEPDVVKLDMALVRGVDREPIKQRLIRSMVSLCQQSGILVVAEGVETSAESQAVTTLGCDLLQGYLFGRPEKGAFTSAAEAQPGAS